MKKIIFVTLLLLSILGACTSDTSDTSDNTPEIIKLKEATTLFSSKLNTIFEEQQTSIPIDYSTVKDVISKEEMMAVYQVQQSKHNQVNLTPFITIYHNLLRDLVDALKTHDEITSHHLEINFGLYENINFYVYTVSDGGLVMKFSLPFNIETPTNEYRIKIGLKDELLYIKQLSYDEELEKYDFFEFIEDTSLIEMSYIDNQNYYFNYINQQSGERLNYQFFQAIAPRPQTEYLMWFNPKTNIRMLIRSGLVNVKELEFFNERNTVFRYRDYVDGNVNLRFELLEAYGWNNVNYYFGVFNNDLHLLNSFETEWFNVIMDETHSYAEVSVEFELPKDDITDEILTLSNYQMNFNYSHITSTFIQHTLEGAYNDSLSLQHYQGIKLYEDGFLHQFINVVDPDIHIIIS